MQNTRTTPLTPFFSTMAILSFKKKGKGEIEGLSAPTDEMGLESENLTLKDLNASALGAKESSRSKNNGGSAEAELFGVPAPGNNTKMQDLEATVNDLKKHAEATDQNGKATKGELENMRNDLRS